MEVIEIDGEAQDSSDIHEDDSLPKKPPIGSPNHLRIGGYGRKATHLLAEYPGRPRKNAFHASGNLVEPGVQVTLWIHNKRSADHTAMIARAKDFYSTVGKKYCNKQLIPGDDLVYMNTRRYLVTRVTFVEVGPEVIPVEEQSPRGGGNTHFRTAEEATRAATRVVHDGTAAMTQQLDSIRAALESQSTRNAPPQPRPRTLFWSLTHPRQDREEALLADIERTTHFIAELKGHATPGTLQRLEALIADLTLQWQEINSDRQTRNLRQARLHAIQERIRELEDLNSNSQIVVERIERLKELRDVVATRGLVGEIFFKLGEILKLKNN